MDEPHALVQVQQPLHDLLADGSQDGDRDLVAWRAAHQVQHRPGVHELHDDLERVALLLGLLEEDAQTRHHVVVVERLHRLHLLQHHLGLLHVVVVVVRQRHDLERQDVLRHLILDLEDGATHALAQHGAVLDLDQVLEPHAALGQRGGALGVLRRRLPRVAGDGGAGPMLHGGGGGVAARRWRRGRREAEAVGPGVGALAEKGEEVFGPVPHGV
mmetsp:Transcript_46981/g.124972  ORF Transcript_46981/g.124972 Transcript_46981/m.124972 type:complete len:215 (+) Transcript_46981:618-1262(+)